MTGFGRILADLNGHGVRYVLIGGIAVIRHGVVRATRDVDAVIAQDEVNLAAVRALVDEWRATRPDGTPVAEDGIAVGRSLHLATPHGDVDLLAPYAGTPSFDDLLARSEVRQVDGVGAPIVSLADLVLLKRFSDRPQDRLDVEALRAAHGDLPG